MLIMGCRIGREAHSFIKKRDEKRIARSERLLSDVIKQARIDIRVEQAALKKLQEIEEGILYGPGIAD